MINTGKLQLVVIFLLLLLIEQKHITLIMSLVSCILILKSLKHYHCARVGQHLRYLTNKFNYLIIDVLLKAAIVRSSVLSTTGQTALYDALVKAAETLCEFGLQYPLCQK